MTFNGSNQLTGITDRVAASSTYIVIQGSGPTGDTTDGISYTESTTTDYVDINGIADTSTGQHFALLSKRNGTADTRTTPIGYQPRSNAFIAADSASSSSPIGSDWGVATVLDSYRVGGTDLADTATRANLWTNGFNDTSWSVFMIENFRSSRPWFTPFVYFADSTFIFEGSFAGFAVFTDWSERTDVETALLAEVGA